jgi:hypothetical protein
VLHRQGKLVFVLSCASQYANGVSSIWRYFSQDAKRIDPADGCVVIYGKNFIADLKIGRRAGIVDETSIRLCDVRPSERPAKRPVLDNHRASEHIKQKNDGPACESDPKEAMSTIGGLNW